MKEDMKTITNLQANTQKPRIGKECNLAIA